MRKDSKQKSNKMTFERYEQHLANGELKPFESLSKKDLARVMKLTKKPGLFSRSDGNSIFHKAMENINTAKKIIKLCEQKDILKTLAKIKNKNEKTAISLLIDKHSANIINLTPLLKSISFDLATEDKKKVVYAISPGKNRVNLIRKEFHYILEKKYFKTKIDIYDKQTSRLIKAEDSQLIDLHNKLHHADQHTKSSAKLNDDFNDVYGKIEDPKLIALAAQHTESPRELNGYFNDVYKHMHDKVVHAEQEQERRKKQAEEGKSPNGPVRV